MFEKVEDEIGPALVRTEVTVAQLERRLSYLTERVRQLEDQLSAQREENVAIHEALKRLQQ